MIISIVVYIPTINNLVESHNSIIIFYPWWRHQMESFSALLAFVRGIHRGPVNSPHKWPVTQKMFPLSENDDLYRMSL